LALMGEKTTFAQKGKLDGNWSQPKEDLQSKIHDKTY
jgi:hypothetical protein